MLKNFKKNELAKKDAQGVKGGFQKLPICEDGETLIYDGTSGNYYCDDLSM